MAIQDQTYKGQANIPTMEPIMYPIPMSPARLPVLTQQIIVDFQVSQKAWNRLSSQMSEMSQTNKLLKRAVKNTYQTLTSILKQPPKKTSNAAKTPKKVDKTVTFADKSNKDSKVANKTSKSKTFKISKRINTTPNTVSEIQTSDLDENTDIDKNDSDSMGWNSLPDMVITSDNSDTSDTDGME